jgi:hypothetical protein
VARPTPSEMGSKRGEVFGESVKVRRANRRTRRRGGGLLKTAVHRWNGGVARCDGIRWQWRSYGGHRRCPRDPVAPGDDGK